MKYFISLGVIVSLLVFSLAFGEEQGKMGGKEVTITGQVIDPACLLTMGLKGEAHKQCATACAKAGQTFGIQDEKGQIYHVLTDAPTTDPNKLLWDHVESKVTVKGMLFEGGGVKAIVPKEVKPAG